MVRQRSNYNNTEQRKKKKKQIKDGKIERY